MSRLYTAKEMREMAEKIGCEYGDYLPVCAMLEQAADLIEREKKYEYAIIWDYDDSLCEMSIFYEYIKRRMDEINSDGVMCHLVRREVGKWEEV